jgi:hypothetical protein
MPSVPARFELTGEASARLVFPFPERTNMLHVRPTKNSKRIGVFHVCLTMLCAFITANVITTSAAHGLGVGGPTQAFPESWPEELQPFLKQTWTWEEGKSSTPSYHMAFSDREEFESAWPHIVELWGKGTPIWLMSGPKVRVWTTKPPKGQTAGVIISPVRKDNRIESPMNNTIALVVDERDFGKNGE